MTHTDYEPQVETKASKVKYAICKIIEQDQLYKTLSYACQAALMEFNDLNNATASIYWKLPSMEPVRLEIHTQYNGYTTITISLPMGFFTPIQSHVLLQLCQQVTDLACKLEVVANAD